MSVEMRLRLWPVFEITGGRPHISLQPYIVLPVKNGMASRLPYRQDGCFGLTLFLDNKEGTFAQKLKRERCTAVSVLGKLKVEIPVFFLDSAPVFSFDVLTLHVGGIYSRLVGEIEVRGAGESVSFDVLTLPVGAINSVVGEIDSKGAGNVGPGLPPRTPYGQDNYLLWFS